MLPSPSKLGVTDANIRTKCDGGRDIGYTFDMLDLAGAESGEGAPVLWPGDACGHDGACDVDKGSSNRGAPLSGRDALLGRHFHCERAGTSAVDGAGSNQLMGSNVGRQEAVGDNRGAAGC